MNNDLVQMLTQLLSQGRINQIEQSAAPAKKAMEDNKSILETINVTGVKTDPLQYIPQQAQMQSLGGLTGMPVPGLGPQSYNPMYKEGMVKEPSIKDLGAMMGK